MSHRQEDAEVLINDITEIAYDKAVGLVTDAVHAETQLQDEKIVSDYKDWCLAPERRYSAAEKGLIGKVLGKAQELIHKVAQKVLSRCRRFGENRRSGPPPGKLRRRPESPSLPNWNEERPRLPDRMQSARRRRAQGGADRSKAQYRAVIVMIPAEGILVAAAEILSVMFFETGLSCH